METIVIAGGSGMIGTRISQVLRKEGYLPLTLTRNKKKTQDDNFIYWNPQTGEIDEKIRKADHFINLAGAGIADKRWSSARKREIIESRVSSTSLLIETIKKYGMKPKSFINASAVGYYGDREAEILTEDSVNGNDFLAKTCQLWEEAATQAESIVDRLIILRIGVVLSEKGGALSKMDATVPYGISSILGSGKQYLPWIHLDDLAHIFLESIRNTEFMGTYNAVGPYPVQQKRFTSELKKAMNSKALLIPTPAIALKLLLGEMSSVVLNSNNASAQKIVDTGFEFQYPHLDTALEEIYKS